MKISERIKKLKPLINSYYKSRYNRELGEDISICIKTSNEENYMASIIYDSDYHYPYTRYLNEWIADLSSDPIQGVGKSVTQALKNLKKELLRLKKECEEYSAEEK